MTQTKSRQVVESKMLMQMRSMFLLLLNSFQARDILPSVFNPTPLIRYIKPSLMVLKSLDELRLVRCDGCG